MIGTERRPLGLRQRTTGARGHGRRRSASTRPPVTNRAYREFVEAGGYDDARLLDDAGWAWRQEAGLVAPQFWRRDGDGAWTRRRYGRTERSAARRTRAARVLVRGRRVRPLVAVRASRPRRSGRSPPRARRPSTPTSGAPGRTASRRPMRSRAHPDSVSKWGVHRMLGDVWEWTASDFRALPGLRVLPVPRVLRGVLRARLQGAARRVVGDAPAARCARRSATGTTRSAARSSPASAARATLDRRCAVTSPTSVRPSRSTQLLFGAPHSLCEQARTPAAPGLG